MEIQLSQIGYAIYRLNQANIHCNSVKWIIDFRITKENIESKLMFVKWLVKIYRNDQ